MRVFIVFRDTIYVSGLRTTLSMAVGVDAVDHAPSIALAWESEALAEADVVVLDSDLGGAMAFVQEIAVQTGARVLLCMHGASTADVLDAIGSGVGGALSRDQLTPDTLLAAVNAVASGLFAFDSAALRTLSGSVTPIRQRDRTASQSGGFAPREQVVLSLVAAGLSNREIAERLSYSERTIKTILHDVVIRLGVKSRSQAVAMAVRERII
ncbi:MAG: LuxR C-terminal-related transcriptional regulator [Solirubrobacteraceae bacterium]